MRKTTEPDAELLVRIAEIERAVLIMATLLESCHVDTRRRLEEPLRNMRARRQPPPPAKPTRAGIEAMIAALL